MATGIFAVLDDIAMLADDVAVSTKIATQKTAGILGDDLAVNAEKATGFAQHRELKVIWAITKGSLVNKAIILPLAFILSAFIPWIIPYILILGGLYLLYEGVEKIEEYFHKKDHKDDNKELLESTEENILEVEKKKIKSAITTDFILSIEIVILALGTVLDQPLPIQIVSTTVVALLATFGVYGLVAMIVRMDNVGFWLIEKGKTKSGEFLVSLMPRVINTLSVVGTVAMLLVGGGILSHNIDTIHHMHIEAIPAILNELIIGLIVGFVVVTIVNSIKKLREK
jgi:predicted DNA repair protein MutK